MELIQAIAEKNACDLHNSDRRVAEIESAIEFGLAELLIDGAKITSVVLTASTSGSMYFDAIRELEDGDEVFVGVRISTHTRTASGSAHGPLAADIVGDQTAESLAAAKAAILAELDAEEAAR